MPRVVESRLIYHILWSLHTLYGMIYRYSRSGSVRRDPDPNPVLVFIILVLHITKLEFDHLKKTLIYWILTLYKLFPRYILYTCILIRDLVIFIEVGRLMDQHLT